MQGEDKKHAGLEVGAFWEKMEQETNIIESKLDGHFYKKQHNPVLCPGALKSLCWYAVRHTVD